MTREILTWENGKRLCNISFFTISTYLFLVRERLQTIFIIQREMWLAWFCEAVFWHTIFAIHLDLSNRWYCASYHLSSSMEWGYHLYSILHQCSHSSLRRRQFRKVGKISRKQKILIVVYLYAVRFSMIKSYSIMDKLQR